MMLWHPCCDQVMCNPVLGTIPLHPNFAIDDIEVDQTPMNAFCPLPADGENHIAIGSAIENGFVLYLPIRIWNLDIVRQDLLNDLAIGYDGIHRIISSLCELK